MSEFDMSGSYVPLLNDEQEVLEPLEGEGFYVEVAGWGYHPTPTVVVGDRSVRIRFRLEFSRPEGMSVPVKQFTLRLKLRDGSVVFEDTESATYQNQPLPVTAGMQLDLAWDIALDKIKDEHRQLILSSSSGE